MWWSLDDGWGYPDASAYHYHEGISRFLRRYWHNTFQCGFWYIGHCIISTGVSYHQTTSIFRFWEAKTLRYVKGQDFLSIAMQITSSWSDRNWVVLATLGCLGVMDVCALRIHLRWFYHLVQGSVSSDRTMSAGSWSLASYTSLRDMINATLKVSVVNL